MTIKQLNDIIQQYNIPEDCRLMSDSGWECDPTYMDAAFYSKKYNTIIFTQAMRYEESYRKDPNFVENEAYRFYFRYKENPEWTLVANNI